MKDLLIDNSNGDLVVNSSGDIVITDSVSQSITVRLKWFFKEWRFNKELGVPYFEEILVKNPSELKVKQIIRDEVLSVEEVEEISDIELTVQPNRTALITFKVKAQGNYRDIEVIVDV